MAPGTSGNQAETSAPTGTFPEENPAREKDLNSMSIEELMEIEVQMVVSASRYRQKVSEAPSSITIITAEDIRKYGYRTLADILRSVRGFTVSYDRNYHYVGVRGFGRLGDFNTRILLLVDGHRINDSIFDSAAIGPDFVLDVDLIERVEVSRGPGSSLYGSNAFFGVVNIITRRGADVGHGELSTEAGSADTYKARLTYGVAGEGDTGLLASVSGFTSDGERLYFHEFDQRNPLADLRATNDGWADAADYERSRSGYLSYAYRGMTLSAAYVERTKGIPTASYGTDFNEPGNHTVDERGYVDLQYAGRSSGGTEYAVRTYYDHYRYDGDYLYLGTLNKDTAVGSGYGGEARLTTRLLKAHRVIIGAEYETRSRQDQMNADSNPPQIYLDDHRSSRIWAAYIQDEITIAPTFLLYAGIRHDEVSTFGGMTNPRLAAVITPVKHGTIKLLYGSAFRAPTVYELYYEAPPSMQSNPDLKPEEIETYELVYEHDFGNGLRAVASRYSYEIRNLITETYDTASSISSFQNLDRAEATGTELEVQKLWAGGTELKINYANQRAVDPNTGDRMENSPRHLAKMNVTVPIVRERLFVGAEEQYTGSRLTLGGRKADGYTVTNMTVLARNRARTLEASFSVYNLFDRNYEDPVSSALFPLDTVEQDGRILRAKITYVF